MRRSDLYQYQQKAVEAVKNRQHLALWVDMGLGKTIITLTAIVDLLNARQIKRVLVVAPKTVVQNVWKQEAQLWEHTKHLQVSVIDGSVKNRLQALQNEADIYCIGRDNLRWLASLPARESGKLDECDMLVCDESTSFKHRNTARWKSLCQKGKRRWVLLYQFKRVLLLSGTPASESLEGLWAQMYLLDRGQALDTSLTRFRQQYMIPDIIKNHLVYKRFLPFAEKAINEKIKHLCLSMSSSDYLQLPDKVDVVRFTGYKPDKLYNQMRFDGVIEVDGVSIMSAEPATRYGKLRQIATGTLYDEQGNTHELHDFKKQTFTDLLEELQNENVLCFYQYDFERDWLVNTCNGVLLDTTQKQDDWNAGKVKLAVANPASLGYGLNIQKGGSVIVWYTLPLSYEQYLQAVKRLHRQGQGASVVRVVHLIAEGTVEQVIYKLLKTQKANLLDSLMEYHKIN